MGRLWDKGGRTDELIVQFTVGDDYIHDNRLVKYDVRASITHATMLEKQGLIASEDLEQIVTGLKNVGAEHERGEWTIKVEEEDAHTAIENRLTAAIGAAGKKVHLARSRNDQVLAALRLYLRDEVVSIAESASKVVQALNQITADQGSIALPGYTHTQQAMPSTVLKWAQGFAAEITDDIEGLKRTTARINRNPLGSVAGYGVDSLDIDRETTTAMLEFSATQDPVTSVQLSRGKAEASVVFELTLLANDLGRLASDVILFYTSEFGFIELDESITTGSSVMPQKRNPDIFELVRARSAQLQSWLSEVLAVSAKLTSGYHRDLQVIKEPLFRAIDITHMLCEVMAHSMSHVRFVEEQIQIDPAIYAAEQAYKLVVEESITFRDAYRRIATEKPWEAGGSGA